MMDRRSDADLVAEVLGGNRDAFAPLIGKYQDYAYGTAVGMLADFDLARDIVQEAFLCAYRDLAKLRDTARFGGRLQGIVKNMARRALRELAQVRALAEDLARNSDLADPGPGPAEAMQEAEDRAMVRRALDRVGERNREALSLFYVNGLSYENIAGYLGVTETTVRGRLERGRAELREEFRMVTNAFNQERLPEDFAAGIRGLLDTVAAERERHDQIVQQLADLGPAAVESLCEALGDPRTLARKAAAEALCRIGDERALRPLLRLLYAPSDRARHHIDIVYTGTFLNIPGARAALLQMLRDGPVEYRGLIINALARGSGDEEMYDCILDTFQNPELPHFVRNAALEALCRLRPARAAEFVQQALTDDVFRRHSGSAWYIACREGIRLPIEACLRGFDRMVAPASRLMAGHLVLRHGEEGRSVLRRLRSAGSSDERATAALALAHEAAPEAFGVLANELLHGYQSRKWCRMIGRVLARSYTDRLLRWVDETDYNEAEHPHVAWTAAKVRLTTGRGTAGDVLLCGAPEQKKAAVKRIAREEGRACLPALRYCLREATPQKVASQAFREIRRMKDAALPTVLSMLESAHWGERKAAVGLLRQWGVLTEEQRARALADQHVAVRHAAEGHR